MTKLVPRGSDRNPISRRWLTAALLLAQGVLGGQPVGAVPYLDSEYGSQAIFHLPEVNGMGGTGAALYRGGFSNVMNPAFLVLEEGRRFDVSLSGELESEDRYVPLFDSFQEIVTETVIASNRNEYFSTGLGYAQRVAGGRTPVTVGLSLTDRYPFDYTFQEEVRDPDSFAEPRDRILEERAQEVNGVLRMLSAGVAVGLEDAFSLGGAVHYAFGNREQIRKVRDFTDPPASTLERQTFDMDGFNFALGGRVKVGERWEFGLAWESRLQVTGNQMVETTYGTAADLVRSNSSTESVKYPTIFSGGLTYRPRSSPRTVFSADAVFSSWSDLEDTRLADKGSGQLQDTMDYRVGVEHTFYNGVPVRFGFRRLDSYADREAGSTFFTAGLGLLVGKGRFDFSLEIGKIVSEQQHLFDYPAGFIASESARVEDSRFRIGAGYSIVW